MVEQIDARVGPRCVNTKMDVSVVQYLLNRTASRVGVPKKLIDVDGILGPQTDGAIREFQKRYGLATDGAVFPNGETITKLNQVAGPTPAANDGISYLAPPMGPTRIV